MAQRGPTFNSRDGSEFLCDTEPARRGDLGREPPGRVAHMACCPDGQVVAVELLNYPTGDVTVLVAVKFDGDEDGVVQN